MARIRTKDGKPKPCNNVDPHPIVQVRATRTIDGIISPLTRADWDEARGDALHTAWWHLSNLSTRLAEAGCRTSFSAGRIGRGIRLPSQFGQMPCSTLSVQVAQKVHS